MAVTILCPHCSAKGNVPDAMLGQSVRCPKCKKTFEVTNADAPSASVRSSPPPAPSSAFDFGGDGPGADEDVQEHRESKSRRSRRDEEPEEEPSEDFGDEDDRPSRRGRGPRTGSEGGSFVDFLLFRRFVTPTIAIVIFYLLMFLNCLGGLAYIGLSVTSGNVMLMLGVTVAVLIGSTIGFLFFRILYELVLVIFRIHDTALEIRDELRNRSK